MADVQSADEGNRASERRWYEQRKSAEHGEEESGKMHSPELGCWFFEFKFEVPLKLAGWHREPHKLKLVGGRRDARR